MTKTPEEIGRDLAAGFMFDDVEWDVFVKVIAAAIQAERDEAEKYKEAAELNTRIIRDARRQARVEVREAMEEAARMAERHRGFEIAAEIRALAKEPPHAD